MADKEDTFEEGITGIIISQAAILDILIDTPEIPSERIRLHLQRAVERMKELGMSDVVISTTRRLLHRVDHTVTGSGDTGPGSV